MARTLWYDARHDRLLSKEELRTARLKATQIFEANPHIFELVTPDKVTRDKGRGVWRVHFPPSSSP